MLHVLCGDTPFSSVFINIYVKLHFMKVFTYEEALLKVVRLKENPSPTIINTDNEWEDILEAIEWLWGDHILILHEFCISFSLRIKVLCYLVYLGFDCPSLARIFSLLPSTIVKEKQRLKKAIGLTNKENLDRYIRALK